jgi:hypothetical protein
LVGHEGEDHRHGQQRHAHHEMDHDDVGIELGVHHEGPQHGLADDADDEARRQPPEVPACRAAQEGRHHGHHAGHHQHEHHQSIAELDERVQPQGRGQVVL